MGNLLIVPPAPMISVVTSRGSGTENLLTADPREVWLDDRVDPSSAARIDIDFGQVVPIDTVFLGAIHEATIEASWTILGGIAGYEEQLLKYDSPLRVPDRRGRISRVTHAFWHGAETLVRYLRVWILQPVGQPLAIGAVLAGLAFEPQYNQEWGSGRGVKDTGTLTRLPSGGFSLVPGARYGTFKWTLGDLSIEETDELYDLQLDRGETARVLVVEDPDTTTGLRNRLHYGLFTGLRPYDRRNARQTRWEFTMEDLVTDSGPSAPSVEAFVLTLGGVPITLRGSMLTLGG
jgi:hypothetical protein